MKLLFLMIVFMCAYAGSRKPTDNRILRFKFSMESGLRMRDATAR